MFIATCVFRIGQGGSSSDDRGGPTATCRVRRRSAHSRSTALAAICALAQKHALALFVRFLPAAVTALITVDLLFAAEGSTAAVLHFLPVLFALAVLGRAEIALPVLLVGGTQLAKRGAETLMQSRA